MFVDLFDSMPDTSFTMADPAQSVDLFTAGTVCTQSAILCAPNLISFLARSVFVCGFDQGMKKGNETLSLSQGQLKAAELSESFTKSPYPFPIPAWIACTALATDECVLH